MVRIPEQCMRVSDCFSSSEYSRLRQRVADAGFAHDIEWAETVGPPENAVDFALEAAFVICNSGMRWTVAIGIYGRVRGALTQGKSARTAFRHKGKSYFFYIAQ